MSYTVPLHALIVESVGAGHVPAFDQRFSRCHGENYKFEAAYKRCTEIHTQFGERAFSHAGPAPWNAQAEYLRAVHGRSSEASK